MGLHNASEELIHQIWLGILGKEAEESMMCRFLGSDWVGLFATQHNTRGEQQRRMIFGAIETARRQIIRLWMVKL